MHMSYTFGKPRISAFHLAGVHDCVFVYMVAASLIPVGFIYWVHHGGGLSDVKYLYSNPSLSYLGSGQNLRVGGGWLVFQNCVH